MAFAKGDDGWRLAWIESRLRYIESAENMSYLFPNWRQSDRFPDEIYFTATTKEMEDYLKNHGVKATSEVATNTGEGGRHTVVSDVENNLVVLQQNMKGTGKGTDRFRKERIDSIDLAAPSGHNGGSGSGRIRESSSDSDGSIIINVLSSPLGGGESFPFG